MADRSVRFEHSMEHSVGRYLEGLMAAILRAGNRKVLTGTATAIVLIAVGDWAAGPRFSLGPLYTLPMMLAATVIAPLEIAALAFVCALLRSVFDLPSPPIEAFFRFVFAVVVYTGAGLFVTAIIRNRQMVVEHVTRMDHEQELRRHAEEQLALLVESSPAAILTTDAEGRVLACNHAANSLFQIAGPESLQGRSIGDYLPFLASALQFDPGAEGLRTAAQCQGRRTDGDIFLAHTWFSSYVSPQGPRLAAIVVDSSEEMREREEEGLRQLLRGNRIATAAVCHEVRNLCGAISLFCSNLRDKHELGQDEDFRGLSSLVEGLEKIASAELVGRGREALAEVNLREVMDDLRIVIEQDWHEIGGDVHWQLPREMPLVLAERHALLQAFLNLAHNSHRAVQECTRRQLDIAVSVSEGAASIRFRDSGPGIADPERLFEPFQSGADGSGLGLYVSRAVIRGYGGDLRFEPESAGACFRVEVPIV